MTDNFGGAYDGTRHLIELGHRQIAIITGQLNLSTGLDRLEGFRKVLQEEHLALPDEYVQQGDFQLESGYRCGLELMRLPMPPTAIFSCNNKMTLGLMRALGELHVHCPEAVSVLGFDDFEWSAYFTPRLTTIAQPTSEMGRQAMQLLLRKLQAPAENNELNDEIPGTVMRLKTELRVRDSTAVPPSVRNVFWAETLVSRENPVFRPAAEIRSKYTAAGAKPGTKALRTKLKAIRPDSSHGFRISGVDQLTGLVRERRLAQNFL